jgi:Protein of unknown function (DUF1353)
MGRRNHRLRSILIACYLLALTVAGQTLGLFSGEVKTKWNSTNRTMTLLEDFSYTDPNGRLWLAPKGWVIDGASIPKIAWSFVGGPFDDLYRDASVIHDVYCDQKSRAWESVHKVFFQAMTTSKVPTWKAKVMFAAVFHFGPRWPRKVTVPLVPANKPESAVARALKDAARGSTGKLLAVHKLELNVESVNVDVLVLPPNTRLSDKDFKALAATIRDREDDPLVPHSPVIDPLNPPAEVLENSNTGPLSLEEIQNFKPKR